ncbi:hypothetical protein SNEBB_009693 [Seison nebaliae]|nr:hypothetical protein SNEBB_009693 [Seison nebaliae]
MIYLARSAYDDYFTDEDEQIIEEITGPVISVSEDEKIGTLIFNFNDAIDNSFRTEEDKENLRKQIKFNCSLEFSDKNKINNFLSIDNYSVIIEKRLNREELCGSAIICVFNLVMEAISLDINRTLINFNVRLVITDANDNRPQFNQTEFHILLNLTDNYNNQQFQSYQLPTAHDADTSLMNIIQFYAIYPYDFHKIQNLNQSIIDFIETPNNVILRKNFYQTRSETNNFDLSFSNPNELFLLINLNFVETIKFPFYLMLLACDKSPKYIDLINLNERCGMINIIIRINQSTIKPLIFCDIEHLGQNLIVRNSSLQFTYISSIVNHINVRRNETFINSSYSSSDLIKNDNLVSISIINEILKDYSNLEIDNLDENCLTSFRIDESSHIMERQIQISVTANEYQFKECILPIKYSLKFNRFQISTICLTQINFVQENVDEILLIEDYFRVKNETMKLDKLSGFVKLFINLQKLMFNQLNCGLFKLKLSVKICPVIEEFNQKNVSYRSNNSTKHFVHHPATQVDIFDNDERECMNDVPTIFIEILPINNIPPKCGMNLFEIDELTSKNDQKWHSLGYITAHLPQSLLNTTAIQLCYYGNWSNVVIFGSHLMINYSTGQLFISSDIMDAEELRLIDTNVIVRSRELNENVDGDICRLDNVTNEPFSICDISISINDVDEYQLKFNFSQFIFSNNLRFILTNETSVEINIDEDYQISQELLFMPIKDEDIELVDFACFIITPIDEIDFNLLIIRNQSIFIINETLIDCEYYDDCRSFNFIIDLISCQTHKQIDSFNLLLSVNDINDHFPIILNNSNEVELAANNVDMKCLMTNLQISDEDRTEKNREISSRTIIKNYFLKKVKNEFKIVEGQKKTLIEYYKLQNSTIDNFQFNLNASDTVGEYLIHEQIISVQLENNNTSSRNLQSPRNIFTIIKCHHNKNEFNPTRLLNGKLTNESICRKDNFFDLPNMLNENLTSRRKIFTGNSFWILPLSIGLFIFITFALFFYASAIVKETEKKRPPSSYDRTVVAEQCQLILNDENKSEKLACCYPSRSVTETCNNLNQPIVAVQFIGEFEVVNE